MKDNVLKKVIEVATKIVKQGKGALFVIKKGQVKYKISIEKIKPYSIFKYPRRFEANALIDGAVILNEDGMVLAYSAHIIGDKVYKDYGTRHSAAYNASENNLVVVCSEEDKKIRIFEKKRIIGEIDPLIRDVDKNIQKTANLFENLTSGFEPLGVGFTGSLALTQLLPNLSQAVGITFYPGVILFAGGWTFIKYLIKSKKNGT